MILEEIFQVTVFFSDCILVILVKIFVNLTIINYFMVGFLESSKYILLGGFFSFTFYKNDLNELISQNQANSANSNF